MDTLSRFYDAVKNEMVMTLATAEGGSVTMRMVSPVYCDGDILIFTSPDSLKYRQLSANPNCCVGVGGFFAEAGARFMGATMTEANAALRQVYDAKFPGAFDEGVPLGGRDAEFILLHPRKIKGWAFENDVPTPDGIPTVPFELEL